MSAAEPANKEVILPFWYGIAGIKYHAAGDITDPSNTPAVPYLLFVEYCRQFWAVVFNTIGNYGPAIVLPGFIKFSSSPPRGPNLLPINHQLPD